MVAGNNDMMIDDGRGGGGAWGKGPLLPLYHDGYFFFYLDLRSSRIVFVFFFIYSSLDSSRYY